MSNNLPKAYDPTAVEDHWAEYWVRERLFDVPTPAPGTLDPARTFTILLPPPNVTGRLHMGHMLNQTEMDILIRWHRMRGDTALWVPGTDHAGIATQMMVERQLISEGTSRQQLGREAFVDRVWQWRQEYGGAILNQMKRLGASVDWSREYFTMDDNLSRAVREAFVRLHEQGLVYRGAYIVNWCPRCQTALSDLEVVHDEQAGKLYEIRYPIADGSGNITIATTRPETMLGDVAVAVNPTDARYTHLHGKMLRLPLTDREVPIIADDWANPEFGTGAVKVTPAHDPNDFAIGQRHKLPSISILDDTAHITVAGAYLGLDRYEARQRILADLEAQGSLVAVKDHANAVGKCDRCKTIVEPRLSTQWFLKIQPLADKAIEAVEQGHIRFTPEQYKKTYFEWMNNIHDWCLSRQLWWGHRIPAWHCATCGEITVARETPSVCVHCGSDRITQETDVLDTWFSSGLLPFTVFDWPDRTPDLAAFYPTQLLLTGFDILFFWVARMIMLGCHFMLDVPMPDGSQRELKDAVPFREVYIHALVRDADRQKMSKTKGNVLDPIDIIQRYGTDAVRFTLASMASPGTDIAFSEARTEGYRAFANKIWNAARFIFMQIDRAKEAGIAVDLEHLADTLHVHPHDGTIEQRWITSRLAATADDVDRSLRAYRFDDAANSIYQFLWGDFCDWYLEIVKLRLDYSRNADIEATTAAFATLLAVFEASLRLLSPFMPFITEEIWQAFYNGRPPQKSIALAKYTISDIAVRDQGTEHDMGLLQLVITEVRAMRKDLGVAEKEVVRVDFYSDARGEGVVRKNLQVVQRLARVSDVSFENARIEGAGVRSTPHFDVSLDYEKPIDIAAERERRSKDLANYEKEMAGKQSQLQNEGFLAKAPAKVVEGMRARAEELTVLIGKTRAALDALDAVRKS
ncbi:MAG: valine--tRNA ligase [Acidobacteriaceae bacterium]